MPNMVAFLRAINVGGRRVTNEELRAAVAGLGFQEVGTYRASGNVLFADAGASRAAVRARLEAGLQAALGYEVPTILRSGTEVAALVAGVPFTADQRAASEGKVQVTLLAAPPDASARAEVLSHATAEDPLGFGPSALYWLPSAGVLDSALDHEAIGRVLGLGTVRTVGTLQGVSRRCGAAG